MTSEFISQVKEEITFWGLSPGTLYTQVMYNFVAELPPWCI